MSPLDDDDYPLPHLPETKRRHIDVSADKRFLPDDWHRPLPPGITKDLRFKWYMFYNCLPHTWRNRFLYHFFRIINQ